MAHLPQHRMRLSHRSHKQAGSGTHWRSPIVIRIQSDGLVGFHTILHQIRGDGARTDTILVVGIVRLLVHAEIDGFGRVRVMQVIVVALPSADTAGAVQDDVYPSSSVDSTALYSAFLPFTMTGRSCQYAVESPTVTFTSRLCPFTFVKSDSPASLRYRSKVTVRRLPS